MRFAGAEWTEAFNKTTSDEEPIARALKAQPCSTLEHSKGNALLMGCLQYELAPLEEIQGIYVKDNARVSILAHQLPIELKPAWGTWGEA